ncbi:MULTISPECIES: IclR family transcriptional regulator [Variovorax]|jgi:DNA-binding IclR family transcriptional regulator|uniref:IclR family transcriptional regulator n=1 Tax=Variovorax TaxID=34072 RepID=UPI00089998AD|nr:MULTISPECIES: IclR family transcriptional regulator [Variovorax]MDQ0081507.1 DNA-binding IclR family transcriptional regulator [Variovorax boronicumulans]SDX72818.1 transcriptional regulator, IclR family [Variovorax sp. YR634]SDZ00771.1 transcriptional regulator, IclR family [Variovorax sp. YR266]SET39186.1 transcriptional regulator, IclR family [Variovorax sp. OV084]
MKQAPAPEELQSQEEAAPEGEGALRYAAPALEKGLDILEALADSATGYTLNELAQKVGRKVSEIFRMAVTLQRRGYVQVDENDRYTLTLRMFELAHRQQPLKSLVSAALPLLRELANRARQSCHLTMYQGGRVVVIAQVESPERWSFGLKVGVVMGLTDTSSGHVLLAFRDEIDRARMLRAHIGVEGELDMDPGELFAILQEVRERGYSAMPSKQTRGITNIAFPVMGAADHVIASINVPYIERIDQKSAPDVVQVRGIVGNISARLSALMGASGYNDNE